MCIFVELRHKIKVRAGAPGLQHGTSLHFSHVIRFTSLSITKAMALVHAQAKEDNTKKHFLVGSKMNSN
jgi:hypothetical protein